MSKSKKKAKGSNAQKRSNKFLANKLRTNQSRSAFRAQEELEQSKYINADANNTADEAETDEPKVVEATVDTTITNAPEPVEAEVETTAEPVEEQKDEAKLAQPQPKDKDKDKQKDKKKKDKKGKRKFGQRTKETIAELKRVTWPTFGQTVKKTGLVIAVVLFFGVALFAIERLLSWLYTLLTSGILN